MTDFGQTVAWMVLSPIAFISSILAIVVVSHYKPFFHAVDIGLLSLFVTMALNAAILLPVPAVLYLGQVDWSEEVCNFYVWATITFRVSELLLLMCLSLYWLALLRCPKDKKWYGSTKVLKFVLLGIWFLAILAGILPTIGATNGSLASGDHCRFLPYELGDGFAVFFVILTCFALCICFICTLDTMLLLKHMKRIAVVKYHAGRFCLPSTSSVANPSVNQTAHTKYNELTFSYDLCRLLMCVFTICACSNHLPYIIIEFMQLVQAPNRKSSEAAVLWLLLLETLILPHALWLVSKRYRHALVYTWKVYVVRDTAAEEEDASACTLQSYTRRVRDADGAVVKITARANGRPARINKGSQQRRISNGTPHRMNGQRPTAQIPNHYSNVKMNGRATEIFTTDLDDGMTVITNTRSGQVQYIADGSSLNSRSGARGSTSASTTPSKSSLGTPSRSHDLKRSSSARLEWKEQMRKKHLPAIFVNEAFDSDGVNSENNEASSPIKKHTHKVSDLSLYYMSSDYHPDHLDDANPKLQQQQPQQQENENACNLYDDKDFEYLLDEQNAVADTSMSKDIEQAFHDVLQSESVRFQSKFVDENVSEKDNGQQNIGIEKVEIRMMNDSKNESKTESDNSSNASSATNDENPEPRSEASDRSITIVPYTEGRRPPWMDDDFDSSFCVMVEPLIGESDTDTFQDSNGSSVFESAGSPELLPPACVSTPVQFDEETDRGFEAALSYNYAYGHSTSLGLCFESIKEEPEEPIHESAFDRDEEVSSVFKTQAVVSSRSSSRTSTDNPSERSHVQQSQITSPVNGVSDSVNEIEAMETGTANADQVQNGTSSKFGEFYDKPYPMEIGNDSAVRKSTVLKMERNVEESTSFRERNSPTSPSSSKNQSKDWPAGGFSQGGNSVVAAETNSFGHTKRLEADPRVFVTTANSSLEFGANPFVQSPSANVNGFENNYDPFQPDPLTNQDRMHSQLPEAKEVNYNNFSPWSEDDTELTDSTFDSDFSLDSVDKSNISEATDRSSPGQKVKVVAINNLSCQATDGDVSAAFF